jgi:hypothetical protein
MGLHAPKYLWVITGQLIKIYSFGFRSVLVKSLPVNFVFQFLRRRNTRIWQIMVCSIFDHWIYKSRPWSIPNLEIATFTFTLSHELHRKSRSSLSPLNHLSSDMTSLPIRILLKARPKILILTDQRPLYPRPLNYQFLLNFDSYFHRQVSSINTC